MQSEIVAVFAMPDGLRFNLLADGTWDFEVGMPDWVKQGVGLVMPGLYIDPILQDDSPYIAAVAELVGAEVAYTRAKMIPPPDAVY